MLRRATESTKVTIKKWKQNAGKLCGVSAGARCGKAKVASFVVIELVDIITMFLAVRAAKEKFSAYEIEKVIYYQKNSLFRERNTTSSAFVFLQVTNLVRDQNLHPLFTLRKNF